MLLKTRTLRMAAFIIALQAGFCIAGGNLLCDSGFEASEPNWGFPDSGCWLKNATFDDVAGCTTEAARSGNDGLLLHTGYALDQRLAQVYQDTPASAGKRYFASAWVRTGPPGFSWVDGAKTKVKLALLDVNKNLLLEYTSDEISAAGSGWSLVYFAANPAPHFTRYARFTLYLAKPESGGQAVVNFDDCVLREMESEDSVRLDEVPACGNTGLLKGRVSGVKPADYSVGVYILNAGWWPKPTFASPWTEIQPDGSWQCNISTALPYDLTAKEVIAFLVPKAEIPEWPVDFANTYALPAMPGEAFRFPAAGAFRASCDCAMLQFAGYNWLVKNSLDTRVDPGRNWFDCSNAWVDSSGLHLKITNVAGQWRCAEVFTQDSLGDGTYKIEMQNNIASLDPNVVLGMFTWDEFSPQYKNREMDIETGQWSNPANDNAQYVIQPGSKAGHLHRFNIGPFASDSVTHSFDWGLGVVDFESVFGGSTLIQSWAYSGTDVPWPGGENFRINLWLNGGVPYYGGETEVVIKNFEFTPCTYQVEQTSIDFNSVLISKTGTRPVTITNEGQCSPYVVTVDVDGPDAANFYVADWSFSLEPGESKQIDVVFVPDANRAYNANLRISGDRRLVTVPLTGAGVHFSYTRLPSVASPDYLEGTISGVKLSDYRVVSYVFTDKWYIKPTCTRSAFRKISSAGAWKCDIDVLPTDKFVTKVASFLVPKNAVMPPCTLNSLNDPAMSAYQCISSDKPMLAISSVTAKAGYAGSDDSITINGRYYVALEHLISTTQLCLSIYQADQLIWTTCIPFNFNDIIRSGGLSYGKDGVYIKLENFWKRPPTPYEYAGNLSITVHGADLTCLRSPLTLKLGIGDFVASATADESLDPAIINSSKPIDIQFLSGCTNSFRVDKVVISDSSRADRDSVYIKGAIAFRDAPPDLTLEDVSVGWGEAAFTVPAGAFKRTSRTKPIYLCSKAKALDGGIVDALFDFRKGTFRVKVSKATLDAKSEAVAFNLEMGAFTEGVFVDTGR